MEFSTKLNDLILQVEQGIHELVPQASTRPKRIHEAMRYSLQAGGKRLRPVLVLSAAELSAHDTFDPIPAAVSVECIHTYSLIHDDLPCMDNDDLRRGRPTAHKQFDEATALLAGDALLTQAFLILTNAYAANSELAMALVRELAYAAGSERLIGGQMEDLQAERKADCTPDELEFIHLNKTAAMIEVSLVMGGLCGRIPPGPELEKLRMLGRELGLAFQIIDDILDATSDSATLGKTAGKDAKADKATFVKLYGIEGARKFAEKHTAAALESLNDIEGDTTFLRALIGMMLERKK
ncbi:MAG TPA: farnesyl diphosphate synthase [Opitutaceae bacterium]|nr:farnesyl diphosphate synthase [Opitutaceae bacterium]